MKAQERLACIEQLNNKAHCVVWQDDPDDESTQHVKYDAAHKGKKPTLKQCEGVLSIIQDEMKIEEEKRKENVLIVDEEKLVLKEQAIERLKANGKILKYN